MPLEGGQQAVQQGEPETVHTTCPRGPPITRTHLLSVCVTLTHTRSSVSSVWSSVSSAPSSRPYTPPSARDRSDTSRTPRSPDARQSDYLTPEGTSSPHTYGCPWTQWSIYSTLCDSRVPVTCSVPVILAADDVWSPELPHDDSIWQSHDGVAGTTNVHVPMTSRLFWTATLGYCIHRRKVEPRL